MLEQVFELVDVDKSGCITLPELISVARHIAHHRTLAGLDTRRAQRTKKQEWCAFVLEYFLSFPWRSVPDLAAETKDDRTSSRSKTRKGHLSGFMEEVARTCRGPRACLEAASKLP